MHVVGTIRWLLAIRSRRTRSVELGEESITRPGPGARWKAPGRRFTATDRVDDSNVYGPNRTASESDDATVAGDSVAVIYALPRIRSDHSYPPPGDDDTDRTNESRAAAHED